MTHLSVATDNTALTALEYFCDGIKEYGIPARIRIDGGTEFNHVEKFMNDIDSTTRCMRGKSVHNQRIERLWKDVFVKVAFKYYNLFHHMERHNILDINNDVHLFSLHHAFKSRIQRDLSSWRNAHNEQGLRTENYHSPIQLWYIGCIEKQNLAFSAMRNIFNSDE